MNNLAGGRLGGEASRRGRTGGTPASLGGPPDDARTPGRVAARGSVLVATVVLIGALSVLLLTAGNTVLLAHRVQCAFEESVRAFYVAEAGLAHARALCVSAGPEILTPEEDPEEPPPWGRWVPFGNGAYRFTARFLGEGTAHLPLDPKGTGLLVEVCGRVSPGRDTRIKMLLEDPPACGVVAWWQTRGE